MEPPDQQLGVPPPPPPGPDTPAAPYYAGPAAPPPQPRPRGSLGPIIAIIVIAVILIAAAGGYFVGGNIYAQNRVKSAGDTYNTVIGHQNSMADFFNTLNLNISAIDPNNPNKDSIQKARTPLQQLVDRSKSSEPQLEADDASLASADTSLKQNQWLTALQRSSLDKSSTKINDLRAALATAKEILVDYQQYGSFVLVLLDCATDVVTIGDAGSKTDIVAITAAVAALKTDATKGIALDHAPGLAPEVDGFMQDLVVVANDFTALLNAAASNNQAAITKAENTLNTDAAKLDTFDFNAWDTTANRFYQDLIDLYNRNIDKANKD